MIMLTCYNSQLQGQRYRPLFQRRSHSIATSDLSPYSKSGENILDLPRSLSNKGTNSIGNKNVPKQYFQSNSLISDYFLDDIKKKFKQILRVNRKKQVKKNNRQEKQKINLSIKCGPTAFNLACRKIRQQRPFKNKKLSHLKQNRFLKTQRDHLNFHLAKRQNDNDNQNLNQIQDEQNYLKSQYSENKRRLILEQKSGQNKNALLNNFKVQHDQPYESLKAFKPRYRTSRKIHLISNQAHLNNINSYQKRFSLTCNGELVCRLNLDFYFQTNIQVMQVEGSSQNGSIKLAISYPYSANLSYNFKLTINVSSHQANTQGTTLLNKTIFIPQKNVLIGTFPGGKIYKVSCVSVINSEEFRKTIFVFVSSWEEQSEHEGQNLQRRQSRVEESSQINRRNNSVRNVREQVKRSETAFSNSEDLMKMVGKSVGILNQKTLDRYILKGRNCRTTKEFVGKLNSQCLKKKEMVLKGKLILSDVYKQRQGMQFFKNDWFMGPFYSYNHNEKKMAE